MALSPQRVRDTEFTTVKRGATTRPRSTRSVEAVADRAGDGAAARPRRWRPGPGPRWPSSRSCPQQARAASEAEAPAPVDAVAAPVAAVDESETISRTLLLAQRTADTTVADADAGRGPPSRRQSRAGEAIIEAAKVESRRAGEAERVRVEGEVQALLARRDFLESDVDHLEQHLVAQRERIVEVVAELERSRQPRARRPGDMRRPLLSASDHADRRRPTPPNRRRRSDDDVTTPTTSTWPTLDRRGRRGRRPTVAADGCATGEPIAPRSPRTVRAAVASAQRRRRGHHL